MRSSASVTTILPAIDMQCAREFYENRLGPTPVGLKPDGQFVYACTGGASIALFPKEGGSKADHAAISIKVDDIGAAVAGPKKAGVVCEDDNLPGLRTVNQVCVLGSEKAAWFKDTEGNHLCLHEDVA